jgi:glutamyl/glutaminyl-tRNA synthetase
VRDPDSAWRLRVDSASIAFEDVIQGSCGYPAAQLGDPILFRRDGVAAYQLAVAVDDAFQGITDVVRGADLLESTAWQVAVYGALALPVPRFAHIPPLGASGCAGRACRHGRSAHTAEDSLARGIESCPGQ